MTLLKSFLKAVLGYPKATITVVEKNGEYWTHRRGEGLSTISDWQKDRAMIVAPYLAEHLGSIGDIGAGDGVMLRYFRDKKLMTAGTGYDYDEASLAGIAASGFSAVKIHLWDTGSYGTIAPADWYIAFEVLEHTPRPEALLAALMTRATHGVLFSVPNTGYLSHRLRALFGRAPAQWVVHPGEHLRFWSIRDMYWWLTALGYRNFKIIPYRGVPGLNTLMPNLFAAGMVVCLKSS